MLCTTASAPSRCRAYDPGASRSAVSQRTSLAQAGGVGDDVMLDHAGWPLRESETTVQLRAAAALQMREPGGG